MADGQFTKHQFEFVWNLLAVLLITGGVASFFQAGGGRSEGNLIFQALMVFFTFPCIYMFFRKGKSVVFHSLANALPIVSIIVYCALSSLWSQEPMLTLRRTTALFIGFSYALYLVDRYNSKELIQLLFRCLLCLLILTFIAVMFFSGIHQGDEHEGAWHGFTGHKNSLGRYMSAGVLISFGLYTYYRRRRYIFITLAFILVLMLSTSKTSLASCFISFIFYFFSVYLITGTLFFGENRHPVKLRVMIISLFVLIGAYILYLLMPYALELLDRDFTFSGRIKIWQYAIFISDDFNLFGAGYRSFWIDELTWDFFYYNPYWGGNVTGNGHSGYLDLFVELGYVGVGLFCWFIYRYIKGLTQGYKSGSVITFISGPVLVFLLIYNIFETVYLSPRMDMLWLILVMFYLSNNKLNTRQ